MKVLLIATDVYFKGGIQRYTRYQFGALREIYGQENVFLASLLGEREGCFEEGIETDYTQGGAALSDKLQFVKACLHLIKKHAIEKVIVNHRQLSVIGYIANKIYGIPYFTNVYGLEIWSGMNSLEKHCLLRSDRLIGDCNFILDYISKHFSYPADRMALLHDPVDTEKFKPMEKNESLIEKYGIPKDKFILSTIGRLERNKGHKIVIRALEQLPDDVVYVIVGGGKYRNELEKMIDEKKLADRVFFAGRVPENELVDFYNIADIVVLLSTFAEGEGEGLPLGLIEASSCRKPIIAGNQDGSIDAISRAHPNGFSIDPENIDLLRRTIGEYLENEKLLSTHGANGRKFVCSEFAYETFTDRLKEILDG